MNYANLVRMINCVPLIKTILAVNCFSSSLDLIRLFQITLHRRPWYTGGTVGREAKDATHKWRMLRVALHKHARRHSEHQVVQQPSIEQSKRERERERDRERNRERR